MTDLIDAAERLRNHLSRAIADAVTDGNISAARDLVDMPVWRFLGEIIGDVEPKQSAPHTAD